MFGAENQLAPSVSDGFGVHPSALFALPDGLTVGTTVLPVSYTLAMARQMALPEEAV